ncbi:MAG: glycosyltransferase family 2 protein [Actinobacteria bacterium]|nr:glycosyltransferase family 2 protein [Actinomycetota bacterium]
MAGTQPLRAGWRATLGVAGVLALAGTINSLRNLRIVPSARPGTASDATSNQSSGHGGSVSILLPLRDEAHRVRPCLQALAEQECLEIIVLDDNSTDGTAEVVRDVLGADPRLRLITDGSEPPPGWLGKPWACARLAEQAVGEVLVFVDADVVLSAGAAEAAASLLDDAGYDVVCPYPRQLTAGVLGRLVQPLLEWSWLTTLVLDRAARSRRPSTATGNGQFLVIRRPSYDAAAGHRAVRGEVIEDVALVRAVKTAGGVGGMADGSDLATCRMYDSDLELVHGYTKSLWSAFGSAPAAAAAVAALGVVYVAPALGLLFGPARTERTLGALGYTAAVVGRLAVATRTGQRSFPDALAHPASITAFGGLVAESFRRHRQGRLRWRGRPVAVAPRGSGPAPR